MRKNSIRILSVMVILALMMFCFTGCMRFRTTMSIKSNGKADLSVIYAFQQDMFDGDVEDEIGDIADAFEDEGWTVDDYKKGEYKGYQFSMKNASVKDFEEIFNSDAFTDTLELGEFELTKKGSTYTIEWDTNVVDEAEDEGVSSSDFAQTGGFLEVVIELPSPAKDENATEVSKDGKTLTWNLLEDDEVEVTFTLINVGLIIAIIAIVVVLVIAAGVVVLLIILKKKKPADGKAAPAAPAPVAPSAPVSSPEPSNPIDFSAPIPEPLPVAPLVSAAYVPQQTEAPAPAATAAPAAAAPVAPAAPVVPAAPAPVAPAEAAPSAPEAPADPAN